MNERDEAREKMWWCDGQLDLLAAWIDAASARGDRDEVERLMNRHDDLMRQRREASRVFESEAHDV